METSNQPRTLAPGDRVRVRPDVTGGVAGGESGTVQSLDPAGTRRPVNVVLDGDGQESRAFEPDELEPIGEGV
jgi:hypothetical protein